MEVGEVKEKVLTILSYFNTLHILKKTISTFKVLSA